VSAVLGNAKAEIGGAAGPGLKSKPVLDLGEFGPARGAPGGWRECSLSAPCIAVQRGAKFDGALPQLFIYLEDRTRPMRIELS
jgi:hypothetical protein